MFLIITVVINTCFKHFKKNSHCKSKLFNPAVTKNSVHLFPTKSHITRRHLGPRHTTPNCPIHQSIKHSKQRGSFGLKEIFQLILWNLRYGHHIDGIEDLHDFRGQKTGTFCKGLTWIRWNHMYIDVYRYDNDLLFPWQSFIDFFLSFCSAPPSPPLLANSSMTNATIISKPKTPEDPSTYRQAAVFRRRRWTGVDDAPESWRSAWWTDWWTGQTYSGMPVFSIEVLHPKNIQYMNSADLKRDGKQRSKLASSGGYDVKRVFMYDMIWSDMIKYEMISIS